MRAMSLGRAERKPDEREPEQKRDADRGAGELLVVQAEQARIVRRHEQRRQRDRQSRNGQDEAHHCRRLRAAIRPPRAARDRPSVRRWGRSAITASRSVSLIVAQAVISSPVRPQPMHKADSGSRTQTLMQGVETVGTALT